MGSTDETLQQWATLTASRRRKQGTLPRIADANLTALQRETNAKVGDVRDVTHFHKAVASDESLSMERDTQHETPSHTWIVELGSEPAVPLYRRPFQTSHGQSLHGPGCPMERVLGEMAHPDHPAPRRTRSGVLHGDVGTFSAERIQNADENEWNHGVPH